MAKWFTCGEKCGYIPHSDQILPKMGFCFHSFSSEPKYKQLLTRPQNGGNKYTVLFKFIKKSNTIIPF